jgi:hypothetical protein
LHSELTNWCDFIYRCYTVFHYASAIDSFIVIIKPLHFATEIFYCLFAFFNRTWSQHAFVSVCAAAAAAALSGVRAIHVHRRIGLCNSDSGAVESRARRRTGSRKVAQKLEQLLGKSICRVGEMATFASSVQVSPLCGLEFKRSTVINV